MSKALELTVTLRLDDENWHTCRGEIRAPSLMPALGMLASEAVIAAGAAVVAECGLPAGVNFPCVRARHDGD